MQRTKQIVPLRQRARTPRAASLVDVGEVILETEKHVEVIKSALTLSTMYGVCVFHEITLKKADE